MCEFWTCVNWSVSFCHFSSCCTSCGLPGANCRTELTPRLDSRKLNDPSFELRYTVIDCNWLHCAWHHHWLQSFGVVLCDYISSRMSPWPDPGFLWQNGLKALFPRNFPQNPKKVCVQFLWWGHTPPQQAMEWVGGCSEAKSQGGGILQRFSCVQRFQHCKAVLFVLRHSQNRCTFILQVYSINGTSSESVRIDPDLPDGKLTQAEQQMSGMLVAVTTAFLILTLPFYIRHITFAFVDFDQTAEKVALTYLFYHISQKLYILNSCINFVLYCVTGKSTCFSFHRTKFLQHFLSLINKFAAYVVSDVKFDVI